MATREEIEQEQKEKKQKSLEETKKSDKKSKKKVSKTSTKKQTSNRPEIQLDKPLPPPPLPNPFVYSETPFYANTDYICSLKPQAECNPMKIVWTNRVPTCDVVEIKEGKVIEIYFLQWMHNIILGRFKEAERYSYDKKSSLQQKKLFKTLKSVFSYKMSDISLENIPKTNFNWLKEMFRTEDDYYDWGTYFI
jgi:hypothetical protein